MMSTPLRDGVWHVAPSRSAVGFAVRHFGVATVSGRFETFDGRAEVRDGELRIEGHVQPASVVTGNDVRDERLRAEFFAAERHPDCSLRARGCERGRLLGELTIRGVTRPVELAVGVAPEGDGAATVRVEGSILRSDFGLDWDALRTAGRLLVSDEVRLHAALAVTRTEEPPARP